MNDELKRYLKKYPEINEFLSSFIFIPNIVFEGYLRDSKVIYKNMEISSLLLIDIISSIYFKEKTENLFNGKIADLKIGCEYNGELSCETLTRTEIIEAFEILLKSNNLNIPDSCINNYERYREKILYDTLIQEKRNEIYKIEIDNQIYEVPVGNMLCILQLSKDQIDNICNSEENIKICNIKKEYLFYAMYKYIAKNNIISNYLVPDLVIENYNRLSNMEMIDFEAINKFYNLDEGVNKVKLSEELEYEIFKNMPSNLNKLEKTMYIYLKMCKLLSYDEEFFFANREASVLEKHKNIEHLQTITLKNNGVVCYEFNAIYAKMLKDLGINFQSNNSIKESYGTNYHTMLDFRCGKYLVSADSLTSIFNGDIINVKLNGSINGFVCNNKNEKTYLEFYKMLGKVYKIVKDEEDIKQFSITDFDDSNIINKLNILIDKTNFKGYIGMDFISYVLKLFKLLFNEDERMNHIKISIIKDYKDYLHGGIIFCVNTHGFDIGEENTYYLFDSRRNVKVFNRLELQELFDDEQISYYDNLYHDLPGIKCVKK